MRHTGKILASLGGEMLFRLSPDGKMLATKVCDKNSTIPCAGECMVERINIWEMTDVK